MKLDTDLDVLMEKAPRGAEDEVEGGFQGKMYPQMRSKKVSRSADVHLQIKFTPPMLLMIEI